MTATNTDLFKKTASLFSTTLSSSIGSSDTTIPLNSVSGLATDTAVTLTLDATTSAGAANASGREVVTGVVSGSNLVNVVRGKEGTQQAHNSGAVVTEYWTKTHVNDAFSGIVADHTQLGAHKFTTVFDVNGNETLELGTTASALTNFKTTNKGTGVNPTYQASGEANRGLDMLDSNGNEILKTTSVASAVNEITLANAIASSGPTISATGNDSAVDINITPKGTGALVVPKSTMTSLTFKGLISSTLAKTANYTLVAADSTVTGDTSGGAFTLTLPTAVGVTGQRYTIRKIESGTVNALTIATTSSQTISGQTTYLMYGISALTVESNGTNWDIINSVAEWATYAVTWAAGSPAIGNGTLTGYMRKIGRQIDYRIKFVAGTTTTFGGAGWTFSLPQATSANYGTAPNPIGTAMGEDNGVQFYNGHVPYAAASGTTISILVVGTTNNTWGNTQPFTWGNTDRFSINGNYSVDA